MQKKSERKRKNNQRLTAAWSGYNQTYVKTIVSGALKALKLLATLTFDPGLFFWTKGLEGHLKKRIEEAEKAAKEVEKYKWVT